MKTKVFNYFFGGSMGSFVALTWIYPGLSHPSVLHGGNFCPLLRCLRESKLRHLYVPSAGTVSPIL